MRIKTCLALLLWPLLLTFVVAEDPVSRIGFRQQKGKVVVTFNDQPIATYVYADAEIPRPYFAHVKAPGGTQVTRNHPPVDGKDRTDHETMHPGIWMAFGDLDGSDFWRNKARVLHKLFLEGPTGGIGKGSFAEEKHYLRADGSLVCRERFRCSVHELNGGYLLVWDSTFSAENAFYFGDQEEMGLGLRVATSIAEVNGGRLRDSEGRQGAKKIWSNAAAWCDYSGIVDGRPIGMTLMCHPGNFRESWMHARDYGFVAANPFGRKAMRKGPLSNTVVEPGEELRLRYAIWIHGGSAHRPVDCAAAYAGYLELAGHAAE
jgi:hypothetical protein